MCMWVVRRQSRPSETYWETEGLTALGNPARCVWCEVAAAALLVSSCALVRMCTAALRYSGETITHGRTSRFVCVFGMGVIKCTAIQCCVSKLAPARVLWRVDNNVQAAARLTRMDACPTFYTLFLRSACVRSLAVFSPPRPLRARWGGGQRRAARAAAAVPALTSRRCVPAVVGNARHRPRSTSTL